MTFKTILVHVDQSRHASARIALACALAQAHDAHLIGAAVSGMSHEIAYADALEHADMNLGHYFARLRELAETALEQFEQQARAAGVLSIERRRIDDEVGSGLSMLARYSDLLVLGQVDPDEHLPVLGDFAEFALLHGGRPVLMVPRAGQCAALGQRVMAAWDGSVGAARALTDALPLLQRADAVELTVFNPDRLPSGAQAGADMALFLARHDVKVNLSLHRCDGEIGEAMLSQCADLGCDMIVMGGYGHARSREIMLGGVTRSIFNSMTVPVLLSH